MKHPSGNLEFSNRNNFATYNFSCCYTVLIFTTFSRSQFSFRSRTIIDLLPARIGKVHVTWIGENNYCVYMLHVFGVMKTELCSIVRNMHRNIVLREEGNSPSHNTLLFTPERDKQPTCGISFRGLLDPKKWFLTKIRDIPYFLQLGQVGGFWPSDNL